MRNFVLELPVSLLSVWCWQFFWLLIPLLFFLWMFFFPFGLLPTIFSSIFSVLQVSLSKLGRRWSNSWLRYSADVHRLWASTFPVGALWRTVLVRLLWPFVCVMLECLISLLGLYAWDFDPFGLSSPAVPFLLNRIFLFYVCYGYTHQLFYRPRNLLGGVLVLVVFVLVVMGVFPTI